MFAIFVAFLFNMVTTFIGCLLLLRTYIFYQRLSIFDPVARLSWACTNWLVVPLSQVFRPTQRWEPASIAGAYIMALVVALVMREVHGLPVDLIMVPLCAVFVAIRWLLELVLWGTIIFVILSWVQPTSPSYAMLWRLTNPFLGPVSRMVPRIANIDFSPVVVFLVVNCLLYWVAPLSQGYLFM